jgi:hypothetical protein
MIIGGSLGLWCLMPHSTIFSVISWWSVWLVEETWVHRENHRPAASHWQTLSHNVVWVHLAWVGFKLTMLVVIGIDCKGSCKSNYHTITTMTAPYDYWCLMPLSTIFELYINIVVVSLITRRWHGNWEMS